jgi:hypothetical protein
LCDRVCNLIVDGRREGHVIIPLIKIVGEAHFGVVTTYYLMAQGGEYQ